MWRARYSDAILIHFRKSANLKVIFLLPTFVGSIASSMIQRVQSVYLILTTIVSAVLFLIPVFADPIADPARNFLIQDNALLLILNILIGGMAFISIFLFKNRKLQIKACRLCLMLIFALIALLFFTSDTISNTLNHKVSFKAGAYLPLIQIVLVFLAQRGIAKDEEFVRSADRLR